MPRLLGRLPNEVEIADERVATRGKGSASQEPSTIRPPSGRFRLLVYVRRAQEVVDLSPGVLVGIGRGSENFVRLDDPLVSRLHARLHVGAEVEVEDLGSVNGS